MKGKEEEEAQEYFEAKGLKVRFTRGHKHLGGFCSGREEINKCILPKVKEWKETIEILGRFTVRYTQTAYAEVAMSLKAEWKYFMRTVPGAGEYMGLVDEALANKFLPKLLGP